MGSNETWEAEVNVEVDDGSGNDSMLSLTSPQQSGSLLATTGTVLFWLMLGVLILLMIFGNVLVIVAISIRQNLRRPQHFLICSLAVADLIVGLIVSPVAAIYEVQQQWLFSLEMCQFWISVDVLACTSSILHLMIIALDRYWSISDILYMHKRTTGRMSLMISASWGLSALVSLAPVLGWNDEQFAERVMLYQMCLISQDLGYQIFSTLAAFYVPLLCIVFLYWRIYVAAKRRIKREQDRKPRSYVSVCGAYDRSTTEKTGAVKTTPVTRDSHEAANQSSDCHSKMRLIATSNGCSALDTKQLHSRLRLSYRLKNSRGSNRGSRYSFWILKKVRRRSVTAASSRRSILAATLFSSIISSSSLSVEIDRRQPTNEAATHRKTKRSLTGKREARASRTLAIVTGTFILCWLPFFILAIYRPLACKPISVVRSNSNQSMVTLGNLDSSGYCNIPKTVDSLFTWLGYANSALNPVIYGVTSPDFSTAFKSILTAAFRRLKQWR